MATRSKQAAEAAKKAALAERAAAKKERSSEQKLVENNLLLVLVNSIKQKANSSPNGRLPHNFILNLVDKYKQVIPTLTKKQLKNAYFYQLKKDKEKLKSEGPPPPSEIIIVNDDESTPSSLESSHPIDDMSTYNKSSAVTSSTTTTSPREQPGRPKGSTIMQKQKELEMRANFMNEVTLRYVKLSDEAKQAGGCYLPKGTFEKVVQDVKKDMPEIPSEWTVNKKTVYKRMKRNKLVVPLNEKHGPPSPLAKMEPLFVEFIVMLSKIKHSISSAEAKCLINALIDNTEEQRKLRKFQTHNCGLPFDSPKAGTVGDSYWKSFLKRWEHVIVSKRARRFEIDRANWTKYSNFADMYNNIILEMVDAGVAESFPEPVWMDKKGVIVTKEEDAFGLKCTHQITHPELVIVADEVGGNTSQKGDGHVGGSKKICVRGDIPQVKACKRDKKFTVLGLTLLTGEPLLCVVIIEGTILKTEVQFGIDLSAPIVGTTTDTDFFTNNLGKGKRFPGGPTCKYKNKEVPCLTCFHPSGGITGDILTDILRHLDSLAIFDEARSQNKKPFLLVDGHGSRFDLGFLRYINTKETGYAVCVGVPYGTSYWQVGDSSEQNGQFKINLCKYKEDLTNKRITTMQSKIEIVPTDIIPMINFAWERSFARVSSNKVAISERGWCPYNRNLLLHPDLRSTMTEEEYNMEFYLKLRDNNNNDETTTPATANIVFPGPDHDPSNVTRMPTNTVRIPSAAAPLEHLNFNNSYAKQWMTHIVREIDLNEMREIIKKNKADGVQQKDELDDMVKISSANMVKRGHYALDGKILNIVEKRAATKQAIDHNKLVNRKEKYDKLCAAADALLTKKKERESWTISDYQTVLKPLKSRTDGKMPNTLEELQKVWAVWSYRPRQVFDISKGNGDDDDDDDGGGDQDELLAAAL